MLCNSFDPKAYMISGLWAAVSFLCNKIAFDTRFLVNVIFRKKVQIQLLSFLFYDNIGDNNK